MWVIKYHSVHAISTNYKTTTSIFSVPVFCSRQLLIMLRTSHSTKYAANIHVKRIFTSNLLKFENHKTTNLNIKCEWSKNISRVDPCTNFPTYAKNKICPSYMRDYLSSWAKPIFVQLSICIFFKILTNSELFSKQSYENCLQTNFEQF